VQLVNKETAARGRVVAYGGRPCFQALKGEDLMSETSNRGRADKAFRNWQDGTGYITDLLADDLQ
jgi:hypothetical protein